MQTCRFCGEQEFGGAVERMVRFGLRHWAHAGCYLDRKPLSSLTAGQIALLPVGALRERGLLDEARRIVDELPAAAN